MISDQTRINKMKDGIKDYFLLMCDAVEYAGNYPVIRNFYVISYCTEVMYFSSYFLSQHLPCSNFANMADTGVVSYICSITITVT